jgi:hypothetical protein
LIIAESGSGKSTSIESLNPKETFIINVANKPLPFKGWKNKYTIFHATENPGGNLYASSNWREIVDCMKYINKKRPEIKTIVVDDLQYMSSFELFDRSAEKGYDKFTDIASALVQVAKAPINMREDLTIFFMTHSEESMDMEGRRRIKAKTVGKMIDNQLTLEGLFSIVLFGKVKKNKEGGVRYVFETANSGDNTCKSPKGMFETVEIPNELELVRKSIYAYAE